MENWTVSDMFAYRNYSTWRTELNQLKKYNRGFSSDRIKELEEKIKGYLTHCKEDVLRSILLLDLEIEE